MSEVISTLLKRNLHEVFGERDGAKRMQVLQETWTPNGVFSDPQGRYLGIHKINEAIDTLLSQFPDFVFSEVGAAQCLQDSGKLAWGFGPTGEPPKITGLDVIVVSEGKIAALFTFLDEI